jgi:O-succinylbenzoic acid--CoA ligase
VFTSGSTGGPRGVRLTAGNHYYNAVASNENIRLSPGDCWLAALPFYHVGGMGILFRSAIAGSSVHIMADFNARDVNRLIDNSSITHISVVPAMLDSIIDARQGREFPPTMKAVLLGGAPVSRRLIEKTRALKAPLFTTYGMTETASQICTTSPGDSGDRLLTSGKPLGRCKIRIVAPDGDCLPCGVEGEIQIRGDSVFTGYLHKDPSETFLPDGWFNTGDIGLFDDHGYLHVSGRKDAMFVSGGENIHPSAIERIAADFPGVRECTVIGVDDTTWGARPILFVEPISAGLSIAELNTHLEANLSRLMIPKSIIIIEKMPRSSVGKIDVARLREIFDSTEGGESQSAQ